VAPGSHRPTVVIPGNRIVAWLDADAGHLWAGLRSAPLLAETVWRFDGSATNPTYTAALGDYAYSTVTGNESAGLWTLRWAAPSQTASPTQVPQQVLRINPDNGSQSVISTLPPFQTANYTDGLAPGQIAVTDGYLFVLEPPDRPTNNFPDLVRTPAPPP
jgi:hypothetical protein